MPLFRFIAILSLSGWLGSAGVVVAQEVPEPGTRWVCVYGWLQIGEKLAEAEQWPLALGSYIEAEQQLKLLKADTPEFETEMVDYRLKWLGNEILAVKEKTHGDEHDIMMKYLDFIESFEQGQNERFNNQFEQALDTLNFAKVLLDEIIAERPSEFQTAMSTHYDMLLDSIIWLDSQVNFKASARKRPAIVDTTDWGTTQFVKEQDLPGNGGGILMSSGLFPAPLVEMASAKEVGTPTETSALPPENEGNGASTSLPRFRMNSQQESGEPDSQ